MVDSRILIVEDDEFVRLILHETLEDEGFDVVEASSGDQAASLIDGPDGFRMVVTDIQMPGRLDGIDVGEHARRRHPNIPVLYVTGRPDSMRRIENLGAHDALLRKPYAPSDVVRMVYQMTAA